MSTTEPVVYLNGAFVPRSRATMDIEDRGTMFGDGVYEVVRYYGGRALAMAEHAARMRRSMEAIRLPELGADGRLDRISDELVRRNGLDEAVVYWQVTRGSARRSHAIPGAINPTVLLLVYPADAVGPRTPPEQVRAALVEDVRWHQCCIKSLMLLPAVLAQDDARRAGADHAILHRRGTVTEGALQNVLIARDGEVWTHPADQWILAGITRGLILELARAAGVLVHEQAVTTDELRAADEVMLTGTTAHVTAVTHVDDEAIAGGDAGPVATRLQAALMEHVQGNGR